MLKYPKYCSKNLAFKKSRIKLIVTIGMFYKGVTIKMCDLKNNISCYRLNCILTLDFLFQI